MRPTQNVHTVSCLHREPGVTVCTCWMDLEGVEVIARAHLSCQYPSQLCDPVEAAVAAGLGDRATAELAKAIEGYHHPLARVLVAAASKALRGTDQEAGE